MSDQREFTPHSDKQDDVIFSDEDLTIAGTGTQWGKSQGGGLWFKRQIHTFTEPTDNFLLAAPTFPIMQQSALPYFLYEMAGYGVHKKADREFKLHTGGTVYLRTESDPDSIVGIPNLKAFWLDEAGKARLYFWENLRARAASKGARGLLTTSPYARNWLYKDYVKPIRDGKKLPRVKLIQAASWENPYHTLHDPKKRDAMRATMDPRRFDMIFGGEWGKMIGLVYDCWDDDMNLIDPFQLPQGTKIVGGIDWGYFPDPFVLKIRAITPDGRQYGISEYAATMKTLPQLIPLIQQKKQVFGVSLFYCDPSQPGSIEELNRNGIPAIGADNDIRRGVDLHYELIRTRRYKEFKGACPYSMNERETYHYPEQKDLKDDQNSKELLPVDQDNHCMDTDRYITIMTYRSQVKVAPKVQAEGKREETIEQHLERLKRKRGSHQHSETFS
jgi:hypothetical protein